MNLRGAVMGVALSLSAIAAQAQERLTPINILYDQTTAKEFCGVEAPCPAAEQHLIEVVNYADKKLQKELPGIEHLYVNDISYLPEDSAETDGEYFINIARAATDEGFTMYFVGHKIVSPRDGYDQDIAALSFYFGNATVIRSDRACSVPSQAKFLLHEYGHDSVRAIDLATSVGSGLFAQSYINAPNFHLDIGNKYLWKHSDRRRADYNKKFLDAQAQFPTHWAEIREVLMHSQCNTAYDAKRRELLDIVDDKEALGELFGDCMGALAVPLPPEESKNALAAYKKPSYAEVRKQIMNVMELYERADIAAGKRQYRTARRLLIQARDEGSPSPDMLTVIDAAIKSVDESIAQQASRPTAASKPLRNK